MGVSKLEFYAFMKKVRSAYWLFQTGSYNFVPFRKTWIKLIAKTCAFFSILTLKVNLLGSCLIKEIKISWGNGLRELFKFDQHFNKKSFLFHFSFNLNYKVWYSFKPSSIFEKFNGSGTDNDLQFHFEIGFDIY